MTPDSVAHLVGQMFIAAFWIFTLWMLWIVAKSLKGTHESLKEIARNLQPKN